MKYNTKYAIINGVFTWFLKNVIYARETAVLTEAKQKAYAVQETLSASQEQDFINGKSRVSHTETDRVLCFFRGAV